MANLYILGVLLLTVTVNCQYYNSEYSVHDVDDDGDHSSYAEDNDKPDYSKYYKQDTSSPLVASPILSGENAAKESEGGFVSPLDFSGFIASSHFGLGAESNPQKSLPAVPILNPFHVQESAATKESPSGFVNPKDFHVGFSEAQFNFNPQTFETEAAKIGQLFAENAFTQEKNQEYSSAKPAAETNKKYSKSKYGSEAEDLEQQAPVEHDSYKEAKEPVKKEDYEQNSGYKKPSFDYTASGPASFEPKIPDLSGYLSGGKTSQISPVKNYAPQYYPQAKFTNVQAEKKPILTPYQKYGFQPVPAPHISGLTSAIDSGIDAVKLNIGNLNIDGFNPATLKLEPVNAANLKTFNFDVSKNPVTSFKTNAPYTIPATSSGYFAAPSEYQKQEYSEATEPKSEKLQGAECQRLEKYVSPSDLSHGRFRRQLDAMDCFVCKDPKTGGSYEKCSYTSDPKNDQSYFRGHAEKYSTKTYTNPEHAYRKRRATKNENRDKRQKNEKEEQKEGAYENPYDFDKEYSHKFASKPQEFDKGSYYKAPDFSNYETSANYEYLPDYFTDSSSQEKSFSELKSEELKKDPGNCKEIEKDSMTCTVCSNPKTGGSFEQCSYTAAPKQKKFAFVKEKKFNSNDPLVEEKTVEKIDDQPSVERITLSLKEPAEKEKYSASTKHPKEKKLNEEIYEIPERYSASASNENQYSGYRSEPYKSANAESNERATADKERVQNHDDYLSKLFPEYAEKESLKEESKSKADGKFKSDIPEYFTGEESKRDVDSVLQEFAKKDRSKCKKISKNKMTCYLCVDNKGIQHEECMFVSESQPKSSHIAYHEVKQFNSNPKKNKDETTADTKQTAEIVSPDATLKTKRKTFPKKVNAPVSIKEVDAEPAEAIKPTGSRTPKIVRRRSYSNKDYEGLEAAESKQDEVRAKSSAKPEEKEPELETPAEIKEGPEGAFASELRPVFSKQLGVTLPAYMLEISEGEKIFDEAVKAGR